MHSMWCHPLYQGHTIVREGEEASGDGEEERLSLPGTWIHAKIQAWTFGSEQEKDREYTGAGKSGIKQAADGQMRDEDATEVAERPTGWGSDEVMEERGRGRRIMDEDNRSALVQVCAEIVERGRERTAVLVRWQPLPPLFLIINLSVHISPFPPLSPLKTSDSNQSSSTRVVHPSRIEYRMHFNWGIWMKVSRMQNYLSLLNKKNKINKKRSVHCDKICNTSRFLDMQGQCLEWLFEWQNGKNKKNFLPNLHLNNIWDDYPVMHETQQNDTYLHSKAMEKSKQWN